jgi:hypothetical protein
MSCYLECVQFIWNRSIKIITVFRVFLKINQKVEEKCEEPERDGWKMPKMIYRT